MIKIIRSKKEIIIIGHSGYAEKGKDIVCCAVSVLVESFIEYLKVLNKKIDYELANGFSKVRILEDDEITEKLFSEFNNMLRELEAQYPEYVKESK